MNNLLRTIFRPLALFVSVTVGAFVAVASTSPKDYTHHSIFSVAHADVPSTDGSGGTGSGGDTGCTSCCGASNSTGDPGSGTDNGGGGDGAGGGDGGSCDGCCY